VEHYGKTSHDATENVEQSDTAKDTAGETPENEQQEVNIDCELFRILLIISNIRMEWSGGISFPPLKPGIVGLRRKRDLP
jgi:hypothetical protein